MTYGALIQTVTNSGTNGVNWIDFTSIPQTYTDLVLVASVRSSGIAPSSEILLIPNTSSPLNCRSMWLTGVENNSPNANSVTSRDYIYVGLHPLQYIKVYFQRDNGNQFVGDMCNLLHQSTMLYHE